MSRAFAREFMFNAFRQPTVPPMFEQAFKNVDDVLWKEAECTTELAVRV